MFNDIRSLLRLQPQLDKVAIICDERKYTYRDLYRLAENEYSYLYAMTEPGDTVLIATGNVVDTIIIYFAVVMNYRVPVIINPDLPDKKLQRIIENCKPSLMYGYKAKRFFFKTYPENKGHWKTWDQYNTIPTLILYTTGSTGEQKGVVCEDTSMRSAVNMINTYLPLTEADVIFNTLPLHHSYGLYQMFTIFAAGGTLVLEPGFVFPIKVLQKIKEYGATGVPLVPTMVSSLLRLKPETLKDHLSSVRYITTAGANLPEKHLQQLTEYGIDTIPMYGQTECVRITYRPIGSVDKLGSTGISIPGQFALIVNEYGNEVSPGTIGELVVYGPHIMSGYLNKPQLSAETFKNNGLYTGDMFYEDSDGYLYFAARKDDIIKIKGEKVSPIELETVLNEMPEVEASVATFIPNKDGDHSIIFHVILKSGNMRDVMKYCRLNLERHLMPRDIIIWDEFPLVEGSNKIDRVKLKEVGIEHETN